MYEVQDVPGEGTAVRRLPDYTEDRRLQHDAMGTFTSSS